MLSVGPSTSSQTSTLRVTSRAHRKLSPRGKNAVPVHVETGFCRRPGTHKARRALVRRPEGSPPRDRAERKHRVLKPTVKTSPTRKHYTHREESEKLAIYTGRSNNRIHLLPKTESGGWSINHDKSKGWDSWSKSSHCSDHNEEPTGPSASPCFPSCHPRHNVSQIAHAPAIPTTSAAWEPPQQTLHTLKATGLTSKLRLMALNWSPLRASPICWCSARLR